MTNLDRVAREIKTVGLYDLILQDVIRLVGHSNPTVGEIRRILDTHPEILREYKQINVEYNLSNIHLKPISFQNVETACREDIERFNQNLKTLKSIEKYTLDFAHSSTLVIIFSIEFFVLFSVQYLIVLMSLKEWQWEIYGLFGLSIIAAWWYANREKGIYARESKRFETLYDDTLRLLESLEERGCVRKEELWVMESDEHV